ncbi:hypothetical protein HAX54_005724, partial [Datura stramonium]|nr:hypothetical protein [Datura stramonium]
RGDVGANSPSMWYRGSNNETGGCQVCDGPSRGVSCSGSTTLRVTVRETDRQAYDGPSVPPFVQ